MPKFFETIDINNLMNHFSVIGNAYEIAGKAKDLGQLEEAQSLADIASLTVGRLMAEAPEENPEGGSKPAYERPNGRLKVSQLRDIQDKVLAAAKSNGYITSKDAQAALGVTGEKWAPPALGRVFKTLVKAGFLRKEGTKNATRYFYVEAA